MNNKVSNTGPLMRRFLRYISPFWLVLLAGVLANGAFAGIDAGFTYLLKPFMNKGFIEQDMAFIHWVPWIILIGITLRGIMNSLGTYLMTWVARSVVKKFRQQVFEHIMRLPASYYDQTTSGQLLSKILYDTEQIAHVSSDALTTLVQSVCLVTGLLLVMFIINWQLSMAFLVTLPFIAMIVRYSNRRIRRVSHSVQQAMSDVTEIAEEVIEGYHVVRIFGGERYEVDKFNRAIEVSRQRDMKVAVTKALNVFGVQCVIALGIAMILFLAIQLSTHMTVTAGGFLSVIAAMLMLIKPMKNLTTVNSVIQRGLAGAESIFTLLDQELETDQGTQAITSLQGNIYFDNVEFAYAQTQERILKGITLQINAGESVALVGRSGSGKSTLVSLLPRFYLPTAGKILIDGVALNDFRLNDLRQQIALVSQHVTLFNDTIANNIAYGLQASVSESEIIAAAKAAHAWEFIQQLPAGLQTMVGENGVLLSGGQRQRLAIARAILNDAPILILDEATSALDTESERLIQDALQHVMRDRTTLVIAHRLSTIEHADRIVVLDRGRIVEQGSHQQLLAQQGHYSKLHQMQFVEKKVMEEPA